MNEKMATKKNQHYVPQMHLKYFSTDVERRLINVYVLKEKKIIENASIRDQASEKYFYGNNGVIENSLEQLETKTGHILKNIVEFNSIPKKNSEEHKLLVLFILFSKIRTRKQLNILNESQNLVFQKLMSYSEFKNIAPDYELIMNNPFGMMLSSAYNISHLVYDLEYKLLINKTKRPFILSDHPLVTYNDLINRTNSVYSNGRGIASKGVQLIFPITPNIIIFLYDSTSYKIGNKKSKTLNIEEEQVIDQFNLLQILNSNEVIYFNQNVSKSYLDKLMLNSEKYERFDKQILDEKTLLKIGDTQKSIITLKNSLPNLKLTMSGYKLQDKVKYFCPKSLDDHYRTDWHRVEHLKNRNK